VQTLVRNLPEDSVAQLEFQDIERTYTEQLERALVRGDVPVAMRRYVRDYFLGISEPNDAGNTTADAPAGQVQ